MALGNVIGSNIFNILFVLGIAATISPIHIYHGKCDRYCDSGCDEAYWCGRSPGRRRSWTASEGIVMLALYAVYLVYICMR